MYKQVAPCPKCMSKSGWSVKTTHIYEQYYDDNGNPIFATNGWSVHGRRRFCLQCNTNITKIIKYIPEDTL